MREMDRQERYCQSLREQVEVLHSSTDEEKVQAQIAFIGEYNRSELHAIKRKSGRN